MLVYDGVNLTTLVFLSLLYFAEVSIVLYSSLFDEIRAYWWDYFSAKNSCILNKIAYLTVCSLCLGFDLSLLNNYFMFPNLNIIQVLFLSLVNSGIIWFLATIVTYYQQARHKLELECKVLENQLSTEK